MGNSNYLIEGEKDAASSMVNDAVFERNAVVEKKIGVQLKFTQLDVDYNGVFSKIRTYVANNLDEYDLVINDLFPFANLSIEGNFRNILAPEFTGFAFEDKTYWYKEYMDDLRLQNGYEYILAGDFFIDVLRSSHLLLFNKGMYQDHYQRDPNEVYDWVLNYEWTYEKMNQMITDMYDDKNRNGLKDYGDQWGISVLELWGSSIGFVVSANPGFITRDEDGTPYPALVGGDAEAGARSGARRSRGGSDGLAVQDRVQRQRLLRHHLRCEDPAGLHGRTVAHLRLPAAWLAGEHHPAEYAGRGGRSSLPHAVCFG